MKYFIIQRSVFAIQFIFMLFHCLDVLCFCQFWLSMESDWVLESNKNDWFLVFWSAIRDEDGQLLFFLFFLSSIWLFVCFFFSQMWYIRFAQYLIGEEGQETKTLSSANIYLKTCAFSTKQTCASHLCTLDWMWTINYIECKSSSSFWHGSWRGVSFIHNVRCSQTSLNAIYSFSRVLFSIWTFVCLCREFWFDFGRHIGMAILILINFTVQIVGICSFFSVCMRLCACDLYLTLSFSHIFIVYSNRVWLLLFKILLVCLVSSHLEIYET